MRGKRKRVSAKNRCRHHKTAKRISQMKVKWNLSHKQLAEFVSIFNEVEAQTILQLVHKDLKDEGYHAIRLHGCAGCEEYIWLKSESHICPNCNNMHGRYVFIVTLIALFALLCFTACLLNRYDSKGYAKQEVFYFPLLPRSFPLIQ